MAHTINETRAASLREAALAAAAEDRATVQARQREENAAARERRVAGLNQALDLVRRSGFCIPQAAATELRFEGFHFAAFEDDDGWRLVVRGACPHCGEETSSEFIESLAQLGRLAERFTPHLGHACRVPVTAPDAAPDAAQRFVSALRDLIREEAGNA